MKESKKRIMIIVIGFIVISMFTILFILYMKSDHTVKSILKWNTTVVMNGKSVGETELVKVWKNTLAIETMNSIKGLGIDSTNIRMIILDISKSDNFESTNKYDLSIIILGKQNAISIKTKTTGDEQTINNSLLNISSMMDSRMDSLGIENSDAINY